MIYLDSCALVKLVSPEAESQALEDFLSRYTGSRQVSSALVRTELRRALLQKNAQQHRFELADQILARLRLVDVVTRVLDAAGAVPSRSLRSLDAIHVVTAQLLQPSLEMFVTYDKRLASVAQDHGFRVVAPA
ncbi:MAG: type II toxin-antitoxin system VapC family toxin [Mycobacteriales bacterium]